MKRILLFVLLAGITATSFAQTTPAKSPASWTFTAVKKADKVYELTYTVTVDKPWHIYSQTTPKGGPVPTKFEYKTNPLVVITGIPKETGELKKIHDEYFGVDVKYFSNKVVYTQTVKLKSAVKTNITGTVEYMVCDDTQCLPPKKVSFDLKLQ